MTRPKSERCISFSPRACYFKPQGFTSSKKESIILLPEELEALRLHDVEGLNQTFAARKMKISQPTFARIICSAYQKVAEALVHGKAIRIAKIDDDRSPS